MSGFLPQLSHYVLTSYQTCLTHDVPADVVPRQGLMVSDRTSNVGVSERIPTKKMVALTII